MNKRTPQCKICHKPGANAETSLCAACEKIANDMFEREIEHNLKQGLIEAKTDASGETFFRLTPLGAKLAKIERGETGQAGN